MSLHMQKRSYKLSLTLTRVLEVSFLIRIGGPSVCESYESPMHASNEMRFASWCTAALDVTCILLQPPLNARETTKYERNGPDNRNSEKGSLHYSSLLQQLKTTTAIVLC